MKDELFYRCERCGTTIAILKPGECEPKCCGEPMKKLIANSTDAAPEKHAPVLSKEGERLKVSVGSVAHPMTEGHSIEWIALVSGNRLEVVSLGATKAPAADFAPVDNGTVYAFCNLHGLWKTEI